MLVSPKASMVQVLEGYTRLGISIHEPSTGNKKWAGWSFYVSYLGANVEI